MSQTDTFYASNAQKSNQTINNQGSGAELDIRHVKVEPKGDDYYYVVHGTRYGQIAAGVTFPGRLPGYMCILGSSLYSTPSLGTDIYRIDLLHELEIQSSQPLLEKLSDAVGSWELDAVYSHIDDPTRHYISSFNEWARSKGRPTVFMEDPPYSDDHDGIGVYIRMMIDRLVPERKSFNLLPGSKLQSYMMAIDSVEISEAKAKEFPVLAAAGWAVAGLTAYNKHRINNMPTTMDHNDWEPQFF